MTNLEKIKERVEKIINNAADANGIDRNSDYTLNVKRVLNETADLLDVDSLRVFLQYNDDVLLQIMHSKAHRLSEKGKIRL